MSATESVFDAYGHVYDALYADKDYEGEAGWVMGELAQRLGKAPASMLELGSGTGRHALAWARRGVALTGVDASPTMVARAKQTLDAAGAGASASVVVGDARTFRHEGGAAFDAVASLFHVASYQTSDDDLRGYLATASAHLRAGGVFGFDFWHGPGVLRDPPVTRVRRFEADGKPWVRIAEASTDAVASTVDVRYELIALSATDVVRETHRVRYFFVTELARALRDAGFVDARFSAWRSNAPLDERAWYGWVTAVKQGA